MKGHRDEVKKRGLDKIMLTVEKIGGTSMSQFQNVLNDIIGFPGSAGFRYGRVFVVSAYAGMTNMLLEDKKDKSSWYLSMFY